MKRVIFITGCLGGVGSAMCQYFKEIGDYVIGSDIHDNEDNICDIYIKSDFNDIEHSLSLILKTLESKRIDKIDCLINNAAIQIKSDINNVKIEDFEKSFRINTTFPLFLSKTLSNRLISGSIINISSIHAKQSKKGFLSYAVSKGGLNTLSQNMAIEFAPDISVVTISPAAIDTPMLRSGLDIYQNSYADLKEYHPCQYIGDPNKLAIFVSSIIDNIHFLTGSNIEWDGGISKVLNDPE